MSDDKKFVNLSKSQNWADEEDPGAAPAEPKTAKTWGNVASVKAVSIAEIQEAEAKKDPQPQSQPQRRDERPREPRGDYHQRGGDRDNYGHRDNYGSRDNYGHRDHGDRDGYGHRDHGDREHRGDRDGYGHRDHGDREPREPRPKNPIPDQPPYVAFFGNLSFNVNEDMIYEYFSELGVDQVRLVNDSQTGKPKGIAYVHFNDREGIENALKCDGMEFYGRKLNVDVAAPKAPREDRNNWGPRDGGSNRRGFGERGFAPRGGDRDYNRGPPPQRKPLNLAPRSKDADSETSASASDAAPKPSGSDPFGGAAIDQAKMNAIAEERLKKEQEREAKHKEELREAEERRRREREERETQRASNDQRGRGGFRRDEGRREPPPKSDKEVEIDSRSSWRSDRKAEEPRSTRGNFSGRGRGGARGGASNGGGDGGGHQKKWVQDEDGFKSKKEEPKANAAGGNWAAVAKGGSTSASAAEEKNAANPYDALTNDKQ